MRATGVSLISPMVAFRNTDTSGRTTGLLLRCVLYSPAGLGLIIVDKRYDHLGKIRRAAVDRRLPRADRRREPFRGLELVSRERHHARRAARRQGEARGGAARRTIPAAALRGAGGREPAAARTCATVPRGSPTGSSSAMSWMWISMRSASGCWSTRARATASIVGQAVLDSGGVFGQVARVGQLTSEVILVSDAAHAIPVQINRTGLRTIAVGTGDMGRLKLPYLPTSADVIAGDLLVTSGSRRRISGRISGRHRRRGQARSGAIPGRCRRETGRRARPLARTHVRVAEASGGAPRRREHIAAARHRTAGCRSPNRPRRSAKPTAAALPRAGRQARQAPPAKEAHDP